jgi:hypothetical protein
MRLETILKEAKWRYVIEVPSWRPFGGTEEVHGKPKLGYLLPRPKSEASFSRKTSLKWYRWAMPLAFMAQRIQHSSGEEHTRMCRQYQYYGWETLDLVYRSWSWWLATERYLTNDLISCSVISPTAQTGIIQIAYVEWHYRWLCSCGNRTGHALHGTGLIRSLWLTCSQQWLLSREWIPGQMNAWNWAGRCNVTVPKLHFTCTVEQVDCILITPSIYKGKNIVTCSGGVLSLLGNGMWNTLPWIRYALLGGRYFCVAANSRMDGAFYWASRALYKEDTTRRKSFAVDKRVQLAFAFVSRVVIGVSTEYSVDWEQEQSLCWRVSDWAQFQLEVWRLLGCYAVWIL